METLEDINLNSGSHSSSNNAKPPRSTRGNAVGLHVMIQLARVLVTIQRGQYDKAQKLLKQACDAAATHENKILDARCKFWEGILFARIGRHEIACQCLLGAIKLIQFGRFEATIMTKYLLQYWTVVRQLIDQSLESDIDSAKELKKRLLEELQYPTEYQDLTTSQSQSRYDNLLKSPLIRTLSRSKSPLFLNTASLDQYRDRGTYMSSTQATAGPVSQTMSSMTKEDMDTRFGRNSNRRGPYSGQVSYCQPGSSTSSLFRRLHNDVSNNATAGPAGTSSLQSNSSDGSHGSPDLTDHVDALLSELKFGRSSRKDPQIPPSQLAEEPTHHENAKLHHRSTRSLGSHNISNANETIPENSDDGRKQGQSKSFGMLSPQSDRFFQPKTFANRRSRIPQKLNSGAVKLSTTVVDPPTIAPVSPKSTAAPVLVNAPVIPSPLRHTRTHA